MHLSDITDLFQDHNIIAVEDELFGDGGKGKYVDILACGANIIARGTGGANAGHTIVHQGQTLIQHLVPSGILWDEGGMRLNIMGNGMVINPITLCAELDSLNAAKLSYKGLRIAWNASLILPSDLLMDRFREANGGKVGTTGMGIGSAYADRTARIGLVMNDLLNESVFRVKLIRNLREKLIILLPQQWGTVRNILEQPALQYGAFWDPKKILNVDAIVETYMRLGRRLRKMITDTDSIMQKAAASGKKIVLEGAQGVWLGVDSGCHPFVTSSDPSLAGLAKGVGLQCNQVGLVLGIVKAYTTRVGEGPFVTEMGGERSAKWCANHELSSPKNETKVYGVFTVNDRDSFRQGIAIRRIGHERGATTGRARRCGWLDLPALRHARKFGCQDLIFTKVDILDDVEEIKVCVAYRYAGPKYRLGNKTYKKGDRIEIAIPDRTILEHSKPIYKKFRGWLRKTSRIRRYESLPKQLREILEFVCVHTDCRLRSVSVGKEREQTIFLAN